MPGKCKDCEFCFPHEEYEFVCADAHYGQNISSSLEEIKECYSEGLNAFIERNKKEEIVFIAGITLKQLRVDGRKKIDLTDHEGKVLRIKASYAKKLMPDLEIERRILDGVFLVNAVFDNGLFGKK